MSSPHCVGRLRWGRRRVELSPSLTHVRGVVGCLLRLWMRAGLKREESRGSGFALRQAERHGQHGRVGSVASDALPDVRGVPPGSGPESAGSGMGRC